MQARFETELKRLLPSGGKVLLAVSGGVDSMVMAELFLHARSGNASPSVPDLRFGVAHCNFRLRGEESDSDERFVTAWCARHGVLLHRTAFDTAVYAGERGVSIEMAARELRYTWFDRLCTEEGYEAVAVAHQANDNVETLFLNLLRGTGIQGLCGMRRRAVLPVPGSARTLIRPLLSFSREEIEEYARKRGIGFRTDATNAETEYRRNRLRRLVFPQFAEINPSFLKTVSADMERFSQAAAAADAYFRAQSAEWVSFSADNIIDSSGGTGSERPVLKIRLQALRTSPLPEFMLYRLLEVYGFSAAAVRSLLAIVRSGNTVSGKVFYSGKYRLATTSTELIVSGPAASGNACRSVGVRAGAAAEPAASGNACCGVGVRAGAAAEPAAGVLLVRGEGTYVFQGRTFRFSLVAREEEADLRQPPGRLVWDYDRLPFPFLLRKWQAGDWFRPLGLHGRKKLSDFFTDLKFNLLQKENAVVAVRLPAGCASGGEAAIAEPSQVACVLCLRIDDSLKITSSTRRIVRVEEI